VSKGAKILIATPGGGGYGSANDRDSDLAHEDQRLGYVREENR
jgi:N-methylhydantoinase B/oxoprolinase/acetone carboxylase alpha subunit